MFSRRTGCQRWKGVAGVGLIIALSGAAVAACGSSSPSTSASTSANGSNSTSTSVASATAGWPKACSLVTASDVTSALGTTPSTPPKTDSQTECDYSTPSEYNYLNVMVGDFINQSLFQQDATTAGATEAVSGLGQQAFESPAGAQAGSILVAKGQNYLRIDAFVPMTSATQAALHQLAQQALARIS